MSYYLVYSYTPSYGAMDPSIYHEGIYTYLQEAKDRQSNVCGKERKPAINSSMSGNGKVVFINVIPQGDCYVQTYTTSPH